MLEEGEADHDQDRVVVQSEPAASLEVIEPEFFVALLMRLFAASARFDCRGERAETRARRMIREIALAHAIHARFTDEPSGLNGQMPVPRIDHAVRDDHAHRNGAGFQYKVQAE